MADTVKARVTNKAPGARGIWAGGELVDIAPGKSRVLDLKQDDIDDADPASFTIETGAAAEQEDRVNNRLFLAAADSDDHANFRLIDLGAATHIGFAQADVAPILPAGYHWGPVNEPFRAAADYDDDRDDVGDQAHIMALTADHERALAAANDRADKAEEAAAKAAEEIASLTAKLAAAGSSPDEEHEPGPLDQSVEKLTAYLEGVTDADEVQKLLDAETAGKSRASAITALETRRDALLA